MDNPKTDAFYLQKMLSDLQFMVHHMCGVAKEDLEKDEVLLDAMLFRLVQMQENARKVSEETKAAHPDVPWMDIAGLRNRIVHDYGNVDLSVVFDTLANDVPVLHRQIEQMLS